MEEVEAARPPLLQFDIQPLECFGCFGELFQGNFNLKYLVSLNRMDLESCVKKSGDMLGADAGHLEQHFTFTEGC